jgi:DNA-binding beta-propeller fold protein YncE
MLRRVRRQSELLERYWSALRHDRSAVPPADLDREIAELAAELEQRLGPQALPASTTFGNQLERQLRGRHPHRSRNAGSDNAQVTAQEAASVPVLRPAPETELPASADWRLRQQRGWRRELLQLAAAVLVFVLVGVVLVLALRGSSDQQAGPAPAPTPTATIPAATPVARAPSAQVSAGAAPFGIAAGAGGIWVPNTGDGTLARIDPSTDAVVATIDLGASSSDAADPAGLFPSVAVAASDSAVWASRLVQAGDTIAAALLEIDPAGNSVRREIALDARPSALALDGDTLWVACRADDVLLRVDSLTGQVVATIAVDAPEHLTVGDGAIWVAGSGTSMLQRVDPGSNTVVATVELDGVVRGLAAEGGAVWVTTLPVGSFNGGVTRVSVATNAVLASFPLTAPGAVAAQDGQVWVVQSSVSTISRIDPNSGVMLDRVRAACSSGTLVLAGGVAWASDLCNGVVLRLSTER